MFSLKVIGLLGKVVFETQLGPGNNALELPVAAGSYLYVVNKADGAIVDKGNVVIMQK